jgi:hypothetical protein
MGMANTKTGDDTCSNHFLGLSSHNTDNSGARLPYDGPQDQPGGRGLEPPPGTPSLVTAAPDDEPTLKGDVTHLLGAR